MKLSYAAALSKLYKTSKFQPVKVGLENMHKLNQILGRPLQHIPIIHVAGTNGKGSVSHKVAQALRAGGIKTGLFTSPHISSFRERVQVNGELMSEQDVQTILPELFKIVEAHSIPITLFELITAMAMVKFQQDSCEAVVLEAGIGGRLDATNIFSSKEVALAVITSTQLDHQKILGDTVDKIARDKAGIMKLNGRVLVGPDSLLPVLKDEAQNAAAQLFTLDDVFSNSRCNSNSHSKDNICSELAEAALVLLQQTASVNKVFSLIDLSDRKVREALQSRPICRFEVFQKSVFINGRDDCVDRVRVDVVLDIAHNAAAMKALALKIRQEYPTQPIWVVVGMSADKDIRDCLTSVMELVDGNIEKIICVLAAHERATPIDNLQGILNNLANSNSTNRIPTLNSSGSVQGGISVALQAVACMGAGHVSVAGGDGAEAVVLVCGSAFIMTEARIYLGVVEPVDPVL